MDDKWFWIFMVCVFAILGIGQYHHDSAKAEVKKACYEAAKTNANLKCD